MSLDDRIRKSYLMFNVFVEEEETRVSPKKNSSRWLIKKIESYATEDGSLKDLVRKTETAEIGLGASNEVLIINLAHSAFKIASDISTTAFLISGAYKALNLISAFLKKHNLIPVSFSPDLAKAITMKYLSVSSHEERLFEITDIECCGDGFGASQFTHVFQYELEGILDSPTYMIKLSEFSDYDELTVIAKHTVIVRNMRVVGHIQVPDNTWRNYVKSVKYPLELVIKDFAEE